MNAPADSVTVLRAHDGPRGPRRLTKAFRIATNGRVSASPYDNAKHFTAEAVPVEGIHDLHNLLRGIEGDPHACVIRGEPVAGTDLARSQQWCHQPPLRVRRGRRCGYPCRARSARTGSRAPRSAALARGGRGA